MDPPPPDDIYKKTMAKILDNPQVKIRKVTNQTYRPPYGVATVEYEHDGINKTQVFLIKHQENILNRKIALFESFHFKENLSRIILRDARAIFGPCVMLDAWHFEKDLTLYGVDKHFFQHLHLDEEPDQYYRMAISLLTHFHALGFAYKHSTLKNKLYEIENVNELKQDAFRADFYSKTTRMIWRFLTEIRAIYWNTMLDKIRVEDIQNKMQILRGNLSNFNEKCCKILINGNYVCNNLFLFKNIASCRIVDFSHSVYNSPLLDVFTFLTSFPCDNWQQLAKKTKNFYYVCLDLDLIRMGVEIDDVFSRYEYEELFDKLSPIMCIVANLNSTEKICTRTNIDLDNVYTRKSSTKLFNILDILDLNPYPEKGIAFQDCYKLARRLKTNCFLNSYDVKTYMGGLHGRQILKLTLDSYGREICIKLFIKRKISADLDNKTKDPECSYKETMFYKKYIKLLQKHDIRILDDITVKCHLADETKYIILENLPPNYQSYSPRDSPTPTPQHELLPQFIEIIAKLHASCIILEHRIEANNEKKYRLPDEYARELTETLYTRTRSAETRRKAALDGVETLLKYARVDGDVARLNQLASDAYDAQYNFMAPSQRWRNTLCHGNLTPDNFMLHNDRKSIKLIDFETYRYAPPAQDLMCLIYAYSCADTRVQYADLWKRDYYKQLRDILHLFNIDIEDEIPWEEFEESCEFYEQFAITQATINFQIDYIPIDLIDPVITTRSKAAEYLYENREHFIRQVWLHDEIYRKKLTEAMTEFRRFLLSKE